MRNHLNNEKCAGIVICPVDESRLGIGRPLLRELSENGFPQVVDLRGGEINAETVGAALTKIKRSYFKERERAGAFCAKCADAFRRHV